MKRSSGWVALLAVLSMPSAEAASREIRALFQPDPSQPNKNVFVNKTPNSGYCANFPGECATNNMFSIQLPIRFNAGGSISPGVGIPIKVPANWRQLTVTNAETQETETVEVRITGIGSNFILRDRVDKLTGENDILEAHRKLWTNSSWVYAPAPCQYSGVGSYSPTSYRFFWKAPVEAPCTKVAAFAIPFMSFDSVDFAYELRTPNPLGMSSGLYTGKLHYTFGSGQDFDFGPGFYEDDRHLDLDFVLDVQHTLKVDLPPGGNKVVLEPEGGWQQWIDGGRKPARIFRDQMFYISASSRFKVSMRCQQASISALCQMSGPSGSLIDLHTSITLPDGITNSNGAPLRKYPLNHNIWSREFQPSLYVDRKVGQLHFEILGGSMVELLKPGVGGTFSTFITIIWDSEV